MSNVFLKISKGFVCLTLLTPLLLCKGLYFPFVSGKIIFFKIVVELALLFYLIAFLIDPKNKEFKFKETFKNPIFLSVCIFCLLFFLSSFWGINTKFSLFSNYERGDGGFQALHYLIFFFLLVSLFRKEKDWKILFIISIIISLFVCFYALGQFFEAKCIASAGADEAARQACHPNTFMAANQRVSGTLGNSSYLAVYLLFHLFFLGYLISREKIKELNFVWGAIAIFELVVLFLTQTRGVFLGILGAVLLWILLTFIFSSRIKDKKLFKILLIIIGVIALCLASLWLVSRVQPHSVAARFINVLKPTNLTNSLKDRFWVWGEAITAIIERPFGWGPENFPQPFDKYYNPKLFGVESWFDRVHNIYLDYTLIGGIPLLLAFLAIFFFAYRQIYKNLKNSLNSKNYKSYIFYSLFFILITAYLIQGIVLFDVISTYIVLFMALALLISLDALEKEKSKLQNDINKKKNFNPKKENHKHQALENKIINQKKTVNQNFIFGKVIAGLLIIAIFFGIYWLGILPWSRSALLVNTLYKSQTDSFGNLIPNFEPVLHHKSPVGDNESFLSLAQVSETYLNYIYEKQITVTKESLDPLLNFLDREFTKEEKANNLISTRPILYMAWINFYAAQITNDSSYYDKANYYFNKGLEKSPTRMEFIYGSLELALFSKNKELAKSMLDLASRLRPDLEQTNQYYEEIYKAIFGE